MTIGEKIKTLRQKKKLSQSELGKLAGVHYTHIGKYESNSQMPSSETLKKLNSDLSGTVACMLVYRIITDCRARSRRS